MVNSKVLEKYLRRNPLRLPLTPKAQRTFTHAVVIPACAERKFLPQTLESLAACELDNESDVAVIVVVNNHSGASVEVRTDNQDTLKYLSDCSLRLNLFYIDAASAGNEISQKGGVGEARKLGMDCALRLLEPVESALMFCLDADTVV
ncbi:MAG: glycosyltransferase family 2 protein, partial [Victivallales bacterium]|nr:glycosyltransferase family 2 protein [Victivallales bacterium]